ncbi:bifunctional (p)ppGpp synthetase/guanosine-3',5'-bis(diphosphate) 3'-pyrophosphohydrolase [Oenococcus sicerae]|uniref:GTP diphosphokinase n=1 Tax=Oenococcus sicerae TaxID=2203724 RepID=A0ABX5QMQ3_9LACO|nr:bifunctional (p)ppGpp synthetase/guanosine-3',5'-bis(diphosphate) 3'-pyrophosphohydrolase [Oenococcus sicerae]QAS70031.1 bifunctional (p)ppGpp synthetase/guanosine-3',5'-bis(diphosphate) 3'-pyrophosphohydrolase [Oenococcus sicerae]
MAKIENRSFEEVHDIYAKYLTPQQIKRVDSSYELAKKMHAGQKRKSGENYIYHPIQVAGILADLKMDGDTIIAGFLHDVVEDTPESNEEIRSAYGDDVANIVDGVTKLGRIHYESTEENMAENHRKLLLAMAKDVRVIIVKLADRLHNMRTLQVHRPDKQHRIASETLDIYAPLAHRLGLANIKWELEDLSLRYLDPDEYHSIAKMMHSRREERDADISVATKQIQKVIEDLKINHFEVTGRPKHIYSIYRKMTDKHKQFSEIYDLLAIRVLVDSVADCYAALGGIHANWKPLPGRFKDYIALPKPNGYQSLHTTIIGPNGHPLEVQIRTFDMHRVAEFGVAAHWAYKENKGSDKQAKVNSSDQRHLNAIQGILELQEGATDAEQFVDSVKGDLFSDRIYAFTPKGDVFELPVGSKPIDMAFAIHSDVGLHTVGAKINGKIVPLDYEIKTGDIVEIITSPTPKVSRDWLGLVASRRARNKIRAYFRQQDRTSNIEGGRQMLEDYLQDKQLPVEEAMTEQNLTAAASKMHLFSGDDLLAMIGYGDVSLQQAGNRLTEDIRRKISEKKAEEVQEALLSGKKDAAKELIRKGSAPAAKNRPEEDITIAGIDSLLIHLSKCCTPIPGDNITGYITKGRGVTVHRDNCPNIKKAAESGERIIAVEWNNPDGNRPNYDADLVVTSSDRPGILNDVIRSVNANTHYLNAVSAHNEKDGAGIISLTVGVKNVDQLQHIMDAITGVHDVYEVSRIFH